MFRHYLSLLLILVPLMAGCSRPKSIPSPPHYAVFDLGVLGGEGGYGSSLNNHGQVVGRLGQSVDVAQPFLYTNGHIVKLSPPGGQMGIASQINDTGQIAGTIDPPDKGSDSDDDSYAFIWQHGHLTRLGVPGVKTSCAEAINSKGDVVGTAQFGLKSDNAFLWQHGRIVELMPPSGNGSNPRAINDADQVAGMCGNDAVVWMNGPHSVKKIGNGDARAINNRGQVVGISGSTAFLWQGDGMKDLGSLSQGGYSAAFSINDQGQIVGNSSPVVKSAAEKYTHAFLWQNGEMYDLNSLIPPHSKFEVAVGNAINNRGQILCDAIVNGKSHTVILMPIK